MENSETVPDENEITFMSVNSVLDEISKVGKIYSDLESVTETNKKLKKYCEFYKRKLKTADKLIRDLQECVVPATNFEELQKSYNETKVELNNCINRNLQEKQSLCAEIEEVKQKYEKCKKENLIKSPNTTVKKCEKHLDSIVHLELEKEELTRSYNNLNRQFMSLQESHNETLIKSEELQRSFKESVAVNTVKQNQYLGDIQALQLKNREFIQVIENKVNDIAHLQQEVEMRDIKINDLNGQIAVLSKSVVETENLEPSLNELIDQPNECLNTDISHEEVVGSLIGNLEYSSSTDDEVNSIFVADALSYIKQYQRNCISPLSSDTSNSGDFENLNQSDTTVKKIEEETNDVGSNNFQMLSTGAETMEAINESCQIVVSNEEIEMGSDEIKEIKKELQFLKGEMFKTNELIKCIVKDEKEVKNIERNSLKNSLELQTVITDLNKTKHDLEMKELQLRLSEKKSIDKTDKCERIRRELQTTMSDLNKSKHDLEMKELQLRLSEEKRAAETNECERIRQELQTVNSNKNNLKLEHKQLCLPENNRVMEEMLINMRKLVQSTEEKLRVFSKTFLLESKARKKKRLLPQREIVKCRFKTKKFQKHAIKRKPLLKYKVIPKGQGVRSFYDGHINNEDQSDHGSVETIYEKPQKSVDSGYVVSDGEFEGYKTVEIEEFRSKEFSNCALKKTSSIENMEIELSSGCKSSNEPFLNQHSHISQNRLLSNGNQKSVRLLKMHSLNNSAHQDSSCKDEFSETLEKRLIDNGVSSNSGKLISNENIEQDPPCTTNTSTKATCNMLLLTSKRRLCDEVDSIDEKIIKKKCIDQLFDLEPVNNVEKIQVDDKRVPEYTVNQEPTLDLIESQILPRSSEVDACLVNINTSSDSFSNCGKTYEEINSTEEIKTNTDHNYSVTENSSLEELDTADMVKGSNISSSDEVINSRNGITGTATCCDDLFDSEPIVLQASTKIQREEESKVQRCNKDLPEPGVKCDELLKFDCISTESVENYSSLNPNLLSVNVGSVVNSVAQEGMSLKVLPQKNNKFKSLMLRKESGSSKVKLSTKSTTNPLYNLNKFRKVCEGRSSIIDAHPHVENIILNSLPSSKVENDVNCSSDFICTTQKMKRIAHGPKKVDTGSTNGLPVSPKRSLRVNRILKDPNSVVRKAYKRPVCRKNRNVLNNLLGELEENQNVNRDPKIVENKGTIQIFTNSTNFRVPALSERAEKADLFESPASPVTPEESDLFESPASPEKPRTDLFESPASPKKQNTDLFESPTSPKRHFFEDVKRPKIIPLETLDNVNCNNSQTFTVVERVQLNSQNCLKMKKNCIELILQLFDSPCKDMTQRVSNILCKYDQPNMVSRLIIQTSVQDVESNVFMKFENKRAPQISQIQFILLQLLLDFREKKCDSLITNFLKLAEHTILSARSSTILSPIARLHTAFLKATVNYKRIKPMIYIALAKMNKFAVEYLNIICTSWPDIFTPFGTGELDKLIGRGMIKAISLKPTAPCYLSLRTVLHHSHGYPIEDEDTGTLLRELIEKYIETKSEELKMIILILGKNLKPKIFFKEVDLKLKPIIENVSNEMDSCAAINLLGFLLCELNSDEIADIKTKNMELLILFSKGDIPNKIAEECMSAVSIISKL